MNQLNIDKWIYGIRNMMINNGVNDSDLSDDDVLEIIAGFLAPSVEPSQRRILNNVGESPIAMAYLQSLLSITKPGGEIFEGIDIKLLRAKLNNN